jgi:hypothetical protein
VAMSSSVNIDVDEDGADEQRNERRTTEWDDEVGDCPSNVLQLASVNVMTWVTPAHDTLVTGEMIAYINEFETKMVSLRECHNLNLIAAKVSISSVWKSRF